MPHKQLKDIIIIVSDLVTEDNVPYASTTVWRGSVTDNGILRIITAAKENSWEFTQMYNREEPGFEIHG